MPEFFVPLSTFFYVTGEWNDPCASLRSLHRPIFSRAEAVSLFNFPFRGEVNNYFSQCRLHTKRKKIERLRTLLTEVETDDHSDFDYEEIEPEEENFLRP